MATFGPTQIVKDTPQWAKWLFRITMALTLVAAFVIAADPGIADPVKVRIGVYLKGLDMLIFLFSKMWGVKVKDDDDQ